MRNLISVSCFICITVLILCPSLLYAHGVRAKTGTGGIVVLAEYTTGEPMDYAKVVITAPDKKIPFQVGRTDRNGRFCFFPDILGQWKVVVSDELGHRLEVCVPVNRALTLQSTAQKEKSLFVGMTMVQRIIMGLSLIFGLTGIFVWWRAERQMGK